MKILPVLDLRDGVVVRGIAGRRSEYRPVVSRLVDSNRPVDVARAFRDVLGLTEFYLADLDAIAGGPPALDVYRAIQNLECSIWVDAGVRDAAQAATLAGAGVNRVVLGLETIAGPAELEKTIAQWGPARVVFSLDLRDGRPMGDVNGWSGTEAEDIAEQAIAMGVRALIVLDIARVGVGEGVGTEALCVTLSHAHPTVELIAGGGVREVQDLLRLKEIGVRGALVASALHDGRIGTAELKRLGSSRHN